MDPARVRVGRPTGAARRSPPARRRCARRPGRPTCPARRPRARRRAESRSACAQDVVAAVADDEVRADLARDRPLGVVPQRQARHAEHGGFLLQPAAVGDDHRRVHVEVQQVEVAERLGHPQALRAPASSSSSRSARTGRSSCASADESGTRSESLARSRPAPRGSRAASPHRRRSTGRCRVSGREAAAGSSPQSSTPASGRAAICLVLEQRVDHHVADEEHLLGGDRLRRAGCRSAK